MKYTLEDLPHLEQEYQDRYRTSVEQLETSLEAMDTLLQISQHRLSLESKENISIEDINHINSLLRIGLGLESDDFGKIFPSLEDITNPEESMEYVDTTISEKLGYLGRVGINAVKGLGEFLRYSVNIINLLSKEYNTSANSVDNFSNGTIVVRNNDSFCYGENKKQVKTIEEYIQHLSTSAGLLITVADSMGTYTRDSFLDNLKVFGAYLTFMKGSVFNGMFDDLYKLTNTITNHPSMKKITNDSEYKFEQYGSDVMLGMFNVSVTQLPKAKDPEYLAIEAKRKYAKVMNLSVSHYITRKPVKLDAEIEFTLDQKNVSEINNIIRPLLSSYEKFNSNLLRLTLAEKIFNIVEPVLTYKKSFNMAANMTVDALDKLYDNPDIPDDVINTVEKNAYHAFKNAKYAYTVQRLLMFKMFVNYNILIRTSLMIIQTNHTIFSLLRGHIKNAIEINKKVAQQG